MFIRSQIISKNTIIKSINFYKEKAGLCVPNFCQALRSKSDYVPTSGSSTKWISIYKFPFIRILVAFNKLKNYQAGLTAIGIPTAFTFELAEILPSNTAMVVGTIGMTGTITLSILGYFSKNVVGFLYVDEEIKKVKISAVDFWGKRKDVEALIDNIKPTIEIPAKKLKYYIPVEISNQSESYKLIHRFGGVIDFKKFAAVFGDTI